VTTRSAARRRGGTVLSFDAVAGYGTVGDAQGSWFFHCTAIADGSRSTQVGTAVSFGLTPGHLGRWEATDIIPA
jgi:cold shock CspA family protein